MSEIVPAPAGALDRPQHGPGRALGQRRKPQLRLSMGYRDEARHGAPVKTDHFLPRGDDRAVAKFLSVYGEAPRAITIRLPGSLPGFLDIRHIAFASGYLRAIGANNFAALGALGGPDVLTVFAKGEAGLVVDERPISGVDDPAARELDVYLQMVVSFGIPDVLGLGGLCQITSRGKESIDTLWENAVDIYGQLGSWAMVGLRPKLVLKPSTMLTPLGTRAELYVLDLYLPESLDEVYARLERHHALVPAASAAALERVYGENSGDEPQADPAGPDTPATPGRAVSEDHSLSGEPPSPPEHLVEPEWDREPSGSAFTAPPDVVPTSADLAAAGGAVFLSGRYSGQTLSGVAETEEGRKYLKWAARNWKQPEDFAADLNLYADGLPE